MLTFLGCAGARLGSQEDLEMSYFLSSRVPDTVSGHKRQVSGQAGWRVDLGLGERGEADLRLGRLCGGHSQDEREGTRDKARADNLEAWECGKQA